ncbi:hypothetical protein JoomaDRAFT_0735 [Galbibacter orientalis DSM 19592]|uniref:Lipocalin-like domain-containing protein n=1 Tax=Galbibacter orientalis DSM 19592 TaxID=926559 RepID=I3C2C6_9FLAO|nr:hypothetical protein [Galbibacter orientalis]EIJ37769.1 hypothetical protein JoomaDRAFT_0735 [Galbibacter orientalis DSM 19592]
MMRKLLFVAAILFFVSCSSDDDSGEPGISKDTIKGSYQLQTFEINGDSYSDYDCLTTNSLAINENSINMYLSFSTSEPCEAQTFKATDYVIEENKIILNEVDYVTSEFFTNYDITIVNENEIDMVLDVSNGSELHYVFVR